MSEVMSKRCPRCKEVDVTDFSTCKACGTRYDAKTLKELNATTPFPIWPFIIILVVSLAAFKDPLIKAVTDSINSGKPKSAPEEGALKNPDGSVYVPTEAELAARAEHERLMQEKERKEKLKAIFHF